ncbi:hypothetical protein WMY93_026869 [Mugilogobius chulae]|uniref:Inositol monophosphatase 1 n=1 Tax=Mugilogobius chulae TaxID=88201 RepID=A0AAW0N8T1_9GOBI
MALLLRVKKNFQRGAGNDTFSSMEVQKTEDKTMADPWLEAYVFAVEIAKKAGAEIRKASESEIRISTKSSTVDLVTATDVRVEKIIIGALKEKYGENVFCFIGEESASKKGACILTDEPTWIIDPVDGTTNFVHGIRGTGTAATNMCMVACGAVEAFFEIGIHCWDVAAGAVIVQEAGGVVCDVDGGPFDLMSRRMMCANHIDIANRVIKEIEIFPSERDDAQ